MCEVAVLLAGREGTEDSRTVSCESVSLESGTVAPQALDVLEGLLSAHLAVELTHL